MNLRVIAASALMVLMNGNLSAQEIKWPKDSFKMEKLADAVALAEKEKKPIAYIIMFRGEKLEREERRDLAKDGQDASAAYELTEDFAKDCAKFAVVVNVLPEEISKEPSPFSEKVMEAMGAALATGTVPAVVIADSAGGLIFARGTSEEMRDDARKIAREAKENHKLGKAMEYRDPAGGDGKKDDDE